MIKKYHGFADPFPTFSHSSTLRVPYQANNGIRVANGSAHGVGIYTATMESPQLSLGFIRGPAFSRSRQLLVCGVLDDAVSGLAEPKSFGALTVKAESDAVRRGGKPPGEERNKETHGSWKG